MTTTLALALSGFAMIIAFMALIMSKRLTAVAALILAPLAATILLGQAGEVGGQVVAGVAQVAPTVVMLVFAILYFGLMIDAGLFDPAVERIVRWVGSDPLKVTLGHMALTTIVALDGDGTTTILVCASAMLPIYRRLGMNPLLFALLGTLSGALMNLTPWAGPSARVGAALKVSPVELFLPLLPAILAGLVASFGVAWWQGLRERRRLGVQAPDLAVGGGTTGEALDAFQRDPATRRPRLVWLNALLTLSLMTAVILHAAPPEVLFMAAFALALVINYPRQADQHARLMAHAGSVLSVAVMALAAGAFTGVLVGSGMVDAMAQTVLVAIPSGAGPHLALITAVLSLPLSFFLSNDAYYFGVVPIIAQTAEAYGISPAEIGRASLLGQPVHALSPLVSTLYLKAAILDVEISGLQRFILGWAVVICLVTIVVAGLTGAFPLVRLDGGPTA